MTKNLSMAAFHLIIYGRFCVITKVNRDSTTGGERGHPRNCRIEVAEVALPKGIRRSGEIEESTSCLAIERDPRARSFGILIQFELEIGFQILVPVSQPWQGESPQVDCGQQVFSKAAMIEVESEALVEVFTAFGRMGVSAEKVGAEAATQVSAYLASDAAVSEHLTIANRPLRRMDGRISRVEVKPALISRA